MAAAALWAAELPDAAQTIVNNIGGMSEQRATVYAAFLNAKVAVTLAEGQAALANALVAATKEIASETRKLVRMTLAVAVFTALAALAASVAAAVAVVTVLAERSP